MADNGMDYKISLLKKRMNLSYEDYNEVIDILEDSQDALLIKTFLDDENVKIDDRNRAILIVATGDVPYIKECVKDPKNKANICRLIEGTNDIEYIKECIENPELDLRTEDKFYLITATKDIEYIKSCVKDDRFNFDEFEQSLLISETRDIDYIKECLEDPEFNFGDGRKRRLLLLTEDIRYIKSCLENDKLDLGFEFEVVKERLPDVIKGMTKSDKIKELLEDDELRNDEELMINEITIVNLLLRTNDEKYIKEYIQNEKYGLSDSAKLAVAIFTGDKKIKSEKQNKKEMNLPEDMTVGIEIESVGQKSLAIIEFFNYDEWKSKGEFDLKDIGCEVISPPMNPNQEYSNQLYDVNAILIALGQTISEKCGGHIHIGADFLKSIQAYDNFKDVYCATEKILYVVSNEKGTIPRKGIFENAVMVSDELPRIIADKSYNIANENDLDEFVEVWKDSQFAMSKNKGAYDSRSIGLNMLNVNNVKNTIEFRFPNGTLNPEMWVDNINLLGGLVAISQELAEIQEKEFKTEEEKQKIEMFERLKKNKSGKEKLKLLLELTGLEPEEYIDRYNTNIELIKKDAEMAHLFVEESSIEINDIAIVAGQSSAIQEQKAEEQIINSYEKNEKRKASIINR